VTSYGARGDGTSDDTAAVQSALKAVAGKQLALAFPAGTYKVSKLILPAGVTLVGEGAASWLQGKLEINGTSQLSDLKIGADGSATRFVNGATDTLLERVTFVGGGGFADGEDGSVVRFGWGRRASFITFRDCTIGADSRDADGVSLVDNGWSGATYHDLSWENCHFLGSPCMSFECIQRADGVHAQTTGYYHIDLTGCVFEPAGAEAISYDTGGGTAGDSTVSNCTIKGSGINAAYPWHQGVEFNHVTNMRFTNNTVYRTRGAMLNLSGSAAQSCGNVFSGNTFDTTVNKIAMAPAASATIANMNGVRGAQFTDNTLTTNVGGQMVCTHNSSHNVFLRDKMTDTRAQAGAHQALWLSDASSDNTFEGCRFDSPVKYGIVRIVKSSTATTIKDSIFVSHGQTAVSVDSGLAIMLSGNVYQ
jgi:hypothetical protein